MNVRRIRPIRPDELEAARALLSACGWTKKVEDPEAFAASVRASQIALVAEVNGQVVGFLRAITDGVFNGYISMVAVAPQRRLGRRTASSGRAGRVSALVCRLRRCCLGQAD